MGLKTYKPTSNGIRGTALKDFSEVTKDAPEKSLLVKLKKTGGRNSRGVVTSRFRGGGAKKKYRRIDFKRDKDGIPANVAAIEYDPNRSAYIALLFYADGEKRYILAPNGLRVGTAVMSGPTAEPEAGNCMPLKDIPLGSIIHNIELKPGKGGQLVRSAGGSAQFLSMEGDRALIVLPSGENRYLSVKCRATLGQIGNLDHQNVIFGKAGRTRWTGRRPHVRGTCQNPVDHPMGGGEGRRAGGRPSCGPTGVLAKGGKTRKKGKYSTKSILRGRKKGKFQP